MQKTAINLLPKDPKQPKPDTNREEKQGLNRKTNFNNNYSN
jgi:hypothetical protein